MFVDFLDLNIPLVQTLDAALSLEQCRLYINRFRKSASELAPVVGKVGQPLIDTEVRNNTRVMWDSVDEANALLEPVRDIVPSRFKGHALIGANERLRLYRYEKGERHGAHWDSEVILEKRISRLTLVFYLNDDFEGGATLFPEIGQTLTPKAGRAALFQHRVLHAAQPVTHGEKFVLRSDVFYAS